MNQLRHHRQRNYAGSSFVTSIDFSPNTAVPPNNRSHLYESRHKSGDKLSNIVKLGVTSGSGSTSMMAASNPPPSVPMHTSTLGNANNSSMAMVSGMPKPSGFTSFMTPNVTTSRTYDD